MTLYWTNFFGRIWVCRCAGQSGHFRLVGPASAGRTFVDICVLYMLVRVYSGFASLCGVIPYIRILVEESPGGRPAESGRVRRGRIVTV